MSTPKNLSQQDAIQKIQELASSGSFVMLCTRLGHQPFNTCPMTVQQVADNGTFWFFSAKNSDHNQDIARDPRTQVLLSDPGSSDYLSLFGHAAIVNDRTKAEELWTATDKAWFENGIDDENFSLVKFTPSEGQYWDTKSNKMVTMFKLAASVITGNKAEIGETGSLSL